MTLFIAAGSWPSSPSSSYSNPPVVDSPMIGGRLNGMTVAVRICCPSANTRAISACAEFAAPTRSANGFKVGTMKRRIRLVDAVDDRKADDRENVLDLRHLLQHVPRCA